MKKQKKQQKSYRRPLNLQVLPNSMRLQSGEGRYFSKIHQRIAKLQRILDGETLCHVWSTKMSLKEYLEAFNPDKLEWIADEIERLKSHPLPRPIHTSTPFNQLSFGGRVKGTTYVKGESDG